jgi:glycosyltransferase involved in cell wall biosynthesis
MPASHDAVMIAPRMRIMIVSDAWYPQTNGVVNTLSQTAAWLGRFGHEVRLITPADFRTVPCPTYPEIRVALLPHSRIARSIEAFRPQALHIATEGPLGFAARRYCIRHGLRFTTSYHTQFPQYLRSRLPVPLAASYALLRWFHSAAHSCMVSTPGVQAQLSERGFRNVVRWRCSGRRASSSCRCRGRSPCVSGAWRWRRMSRLSCACHGTAASW